MSVCLGSWVKWITSYNCGVVLIILIAVIAVIIGLDHAQDNFGWVQSNLVEKRCFSSTWVGWLCLAYRRFNWPSEIVVQMIFSRNGISSPKPSDTFALSLSCLFLLGKTFHDMISLTCENIKFYRVSQKKWLTELMKSSNFGRNLVSQNAGCEGRVHKFYSIFWDPLQCIISREVGEKTDDSRALSRLEPTMRCHWQL